MAQARWENPAVRQQLLPAAGETGMAQAGPTKPAGGPLLSFTLSWQWERGHMLLFV